MPDAAPAATTTTLSRSHTTGTVTANHDEATSIFNEIWPEIVAKVEAGKATLPREFIWLGGAPGAGKGTNTPFILRVRGITALPIVTSDLLNTPEMKAIKDRGNLVGDREVARALFNKLLEPDYINGALIDGFPRTQIQVELVKLFYQKLLDLRAKYRGTHRAAHFTKPVFHVVVLYVGEKESIERQIKRGRSVVAHNQRVRETGVGELQEERVTDLNEDYCRKRYKVFMEQTVAVLQTLKQVFHYHVINATGDLGSVERAIQKEFQYQSSLELDEETFDAIHHIPLATEIVLNARQHLVARLESYQRDHSALFHRVIHVIQHEFVAVIQIHAIGGRAKLTTENEIFADPLAMNMLIDVMNERGYGVTSYQEFRDVPVRIDPATQTILSARRARYYFEISFAGSAIRRGV